MSKYKIGVAVFDAKKTNLSFEEFIAALTKEGCTIKSMTVTEWLNSPVLLRADTLSTPVKAMAIVKFIAPVTEEIKTV